MKEIVFCAFDVFGEDDAELRKEFCAIFNDFSDVFSDNDELVVL